MPTARVDLSTAGVKMFYSTAESINAIVTKTELEGVKEIPEMNPAPDTLETTTLNDLEYKTYIDGLKDIGGALSFTFNLTQKLVDDWATLMQAYREKDVNESIFFIIEIPGIEKALYFKGNPSELGLPSMGVNSVLETTCYITPTAAPEWAAKKEA